MLMMVSLPSSSLALIILVVARVGADYNSSCSVCLSNASLTVTEFKRFEVGEGIEKKEVSFADEVAAAQAAAAAQ